MIKLKKNHKRCLSFIKKFSRNEEGVAAIEFAIVAIPFMALLFGILELAIVFFMSSALQSANFEAARLIRTGQYTATDESAYETQICEYMNPNSAGKVTQCESRLSVTVVLLTDFAAYTSSNFGSGVSTVPTDTNGDPINFTASAGGDTVIITATYQHPLSLPGQYTKLKNVSGDDNIRELISVTAFRNEPFSG